jgi:plasmid stability protein
VRTTLTLDDDVAAKLKAETRRSGRSLKETVNDILRRGFSARPAVAPRASFKVVARDLGRLGPGLSLDDVADVIERTEGPRHR